MRPRFWLEGSPAVDRPDDARTAALADLYRAALEAPHERALFERIGAALSKGVDGWKVAARSGDGGWTTLAAHGASIDLPIALLADVLDRGLPAAEGPWLVAPLVERATSGELLIATTQSPPNETHLGSIAEFALGLGAALRYVRANEKLHARSARLEQLLTIASRWNQSRHTDALLVEIAEAATRFLGCDRSTIFLWDRPRKQLIGRPALGVEGGELRVPDTAGVVGRVIRSGLPERVDRVDRPEVIDRQADRQLGFTTQNLLCVPLRTGPGQVLGAFEVLNKSAGDFTADDEQALTELAQQAAIALAQTQEREQLAASSRQVAEEAAQGVRLVGTDPAIEQLRATIQRVAETDLAVLILGENGSGKEVVAQSIHYQGRRRDRPFIAVNCAALSETLLESELFGHEKGAFTDAREARAGKFELAAGGTLFLDEIGDLSAGGQAKLLRVLEEKVVVRVGGSKPIATDARVVAATNQPLTALVHQKRFRQDLFFRLNVVTLDLPPLRERPSDIERLAMFFLEEFSRRARHNAPELSPEARVTLQSHAWPGNVRELRNLMERLAYLHVGDRIEANDLGLSRATAANASPDPSADRPLAEATDEFQMAYINAAIARADGNMTEGAKRLGLHRSNLYRKMRQLGMQPPED